MIIKKSTTALLGLLSAGALATANAGTPMSTPVSTSDDSSIFSGSIAVGYDSEYIFRGVNFGTDAPWAGVDTNFELSDALSLNVGAWYINPTGGGRDNDELDLYAFLNTTLGALDVGVGVTSYQFPEAGSDALEAALTLGYSVGIIDLGFLYAYDFETEGTYLETSVGTTIEITDNVALELGTGVSYGDDYYGVSGFNNVFVKAAIPIALTETLTLTPYIANSWAIDSLEDTGEDDHLFGGASLSVDF